MTPTSALPHITSGDGAQQGRTRRDARGSSKTRECSHREAHVCELFDEPVHDPGLVLLAGRLHALEQSASKGESMSHAFFLETGAAYDSRGFYSHRTFSC